MCCPSHLEATKMREKKKGTSLLSYCLVKMVNHPPVFMIKHLRTIKLCGLCHLNVYLLATEYLHKITSFNLNSMQINLAIIKGDNIPLGIIILSSLLFYNTMFKIVYLPGYSGTPWNYLNLQYFYKYLKTLF